MPKKNKEEYNKYMRVYMLKRYRKRMDWARKTLGGSCTQCGSIRDLELDHIDPGTKKFTVGRMWSVSEKAFADEVAKCQLLCRECHQDKTIFDRGFKKAKGEHGTISTYRYCRCADCKKACRDYARRYKARKKREANAEVDEAPSF